MTTMPWEVNVELPPGFEGPVNVRVTFSVVASTPVPVNGNGVDPMSLAIEKQLQRFEARVPDTAAREIVAKMADRGWVVAMPQGRDGKPSKAAYLRVTFVGAKRAVTLLANTRSLQCQAKGIDSYADDIAKSEVHDDLSMYVYFNEGKVDQALEAVADFERYANGELDQ